MTTLLLAALLNLSPGFQLADNVDAMTRAHVNSELHLLDAERPQLDDFDRARPPPAPAYLQTVMNF